MNNISIDTESLEMSISVFEDCLKHITEILDNESKNIETINATDVWSSKTQETIYNKFKELEENFMPIKDSLKLYIKFMKKTVDDYSRLDKFVSASAEAANEQLNVNS